MTVIQSCESKAQKTQLKIMTIDGPAASGKTSVSRAIAKALNWNWISTGAFYRAIAFITLKAGLDLKDESKILEAIKTTNWKVAMQSEKTAIYIQGEDISKQSLFESEIWADRASQVSLLPQIREALLQPQRDCLQQATNGLIAEGRDCGSVVFPDADLKIYLTAPPTIRSQRRATDIGSSKEQVLADQQRRDERDTQRNIAPLQVAPGAYIIDSSQKDLKAITQILIEKAQSL